MKAGSIKWARSPPHFIYSLRVDRTRRKETKEPVFASLDLVELAASQEAIQDAHIAHLFNSISSVVVKTAHSRVKPNITESLFKYLTVPLYESNKVKLIVTVAPGVELSFQHSVAALKFSSQIRYHILKNQSCPVSETKESETEEDTETSEQPPLTEEYVGHFLKDLDMIREEIVEREEQTADMKWVEERRKIVDEMIQIVQENPSMPRTVLEDLLLLQQALEQKAQQYLKMQTPPPYPIALKSTPLRTERSLDVQYQTQRDTPQFSELRSKEFESTRKLDFYSVTPEMSTPLMGSGLSESSIKPRDKGRQSNTMREISEDEEELSLISREGGGEIIKAITQTESSHLSMEERVRRLEREIQFKDEIIAKYEDLFGGEGAQEKENYNLMNQRYKGIIGELRDRLKERNAQVHELEQELERRGVVERGFEKSWQLEKEHEELKLKYKQRQKVVEDLEGRLEAVRGEIEERCMRVEEREEKESYLKVEKVRREMEAMRQEKKELESSRMALIQRVSSLESDLGEVQKERDQLKTQFSRLLDQSQRQISELEVASNELGVYREKNEMKQSSKIKELALNNQSLLKELKEVKTELKEKIDELDQVGQQKEEAEEELQFVKSQQSAEINLIDRKCDSVQEVNMKLMEENGALRQKEIDYRREMRRLEKARENYKEQYLEIKRELKELKQENQSLKRDRQQEKREFERRTIERNLEQEYEDEEAKQDSKTQMVTDIKDLIAQYKLEKQTKRVINF